jgi:drug/metabolite transporter (DMT)-like permease
MPTMNDALRPAAAVSVPAAPTFARTLGLTVVAMLAFAANSLLCRLALQHGAIDAASFGSVRLASGALALGLILLWRHRANAADATGPSNAANAANAAGAASAPARPTPDWWAAAMLWAYVACFSFAYLSLSAGTGALILFGCVQLTMFAAGLRAGERFGPRAWGGFVAALAGLVYLVSPGLAAPPLLGALLMAAAGVAWGLYSLRGRRAGDPLVATGANFLRATPMALALSALSLSAFHASGPGVLLAVLSGALTSGLGYVVWYAALRGLTALRAATVQLSVPPLAALGGALLLSEALTPRLMLASAAILGGVALVLFSRAAAAKR